MTASRVDPTPARPPAISLIDSANPRAVDVDAVRNSDGVTVRWIGGFAYRPNACDSGDIIDPRATSTLPAADTFENIIEVFPVEAIGSDKVSTFDGRRAFEESLERARQNLLVCESKLLEAELWSGTVTRTAQEGPNRFLTDANVELIEGDRPLGYLTALAQLERAIAEGTCNGRGMIHARRDTVSLWATGGMLRRVGNLLLTAMDTIVVPGAGYDGSAPVAEADGLDPNHAEQVPSADSAWAYATGIVDVWRSTINDGTEQERFDPSTTDPTKANLITSRARRFVAATWGCLQVGVHVDHTTRHTVSGS